MKLLILLFFMVNLYANGLIDATKQYLQDHNKTYFKQNIMDLAYHDPKRFHYNYLALYRDPKLSEYRDVFKNKFNRFTENIIVRAYAAHDLFIDARIQEYVVSYAFYSSAVGKATYSKEFIELFKIYFNYSEENNTKINQDIYTILYANYLLSQNENKEAYKILKEQAPYSIRALRIIRSYSNIKHIPLYNDRAKLFESIGSQKLKLKEAVLEYRGNNIVF